MLQRDGHTSLTDLARMIGGLSKVAVSYRVRRLKKKGVLEGFHAKINPEAVGQGIIFATRLVLKNKGPQGTLAARKIAALKGVQSVFLVFGEYDALVIARARDASSARDLVYRIYATGAIRSSNTTLAHTVIKETVEVHI